MINLYWGRGQLDTLNNYLEKKLISLPGKSDSTVVRKLNVLIKRIQENEACLTHAEKPLSEFFRFIKSCFQIQKMTVDLGEDEQTVRHELKHALRVARSRFTQLEITSDEEQELVGHRRSLNKIKALEKVDETFYLQTLAKWIAHQKIPINKLELSDRELQELAPHLTYLKISLPFRDKPLGDLLGRTKHLRHLSIEDCAITGSVFRKFTNTHRLKSLTLKQCRFLKHRLPKEMPALKELNIEDCPKLSQDVRLKFLTPIYLADKERALEFAKSMEVSHFLIWGKLYQGIDSIDDLEFLIQRLSYDEQVDFLEAMIPFGLRNILNHPRQFLLALLRTEAGKEFVTSKLTEFLQDPELLELLQAAYPPDRPENLPFYPIKLAINGEVLHLTMIPTMARDYPDQVVRTLMRSNCKTIRVFHYGRADDIERDLTTEFFVELLQGPISCKPTKFKHGNWTIAPSDLGRILGLALRTGCPIGDVFEMDFMQSLRAISIKDIHSHRAFDQSVAHGMARYLPFEIKKLNGTTLLISQLQDLKDVSNEEFAMQLQGRGTMMKAFVLNPDYREAYRDFVRENIVSFLEEPGVLPVLCAAYPPGKPENVGFYPVKAHILNSVLYLTMIPTMPRDYPDEVFDILAAHRAEFSFLSIAHYGSAVVDRGGPKNQFFADLMQGLIQSSKIYKFAKTDNGKLYLVAHPMWSRKGHYCTNSLIHYSLGAVIGLALRSGCPIGDVFCKEFIHCLRSFSKADLEFAQKKMTPYEFFRRLSPKDLIAYMRESVPPSPETAFVEKVLLSEKEEDICVAARDLNDCWLDDSLSTAIDYGDIFRIKRIVRGLWLEGYCGYIHTVHSFATGLMMSLPFEIQVDDQKTLTIRQWDDLAFITTEDLVLRLQGKLTVEWIKKHLEFKPNPSPEAENVKMWVGQWFDDHEGEDEVLANVIQTLTGARALTSKIIFKLTPNMKGLYVHTCFQSVDVPVDIDEEGVRAVLDAYGRGEHLQFNKS